MKIFSYLFEIREFLRCLIFFRKKSKITKTFSKDRKRKKSRNPENVGSEKIKYFFGIQIFKTHFLLK